MPPSPTNTWNTHEQHTRSRSRSTHIINSGRAAAAAAAAAARPSSWHPSAWFAQALPRTRPARRCPCRTALGTLSCSAALAPSGSWGDVISLVQAVYSHTLQPTHFIPSLRVAASSASRSTSILACAPVSVGPGGPSPGGGGGWRLPGINDVGPTPSGRAQLRGQKSRTWKCGVHAPAGSIAAVRSTLSEDAQQLSVLRKRESVGRAPSVTVGCGTFRGSGGRYGLLLVVLRHLLNSSTPGLGFYPQRPQKA